MYRRSCNSFDVFKCVCHFAPTTMYRENTSSFHDHVCNPSIAQSYQIYNITRRAPRKNLHPTSTSYHFALPLAPSINPLIPPLFPPKP
jgi:hypothetical protein